MPNGLFGIDSLDLAAKPMLDQALSFCHTTPVFWGRYFKGPGGGDGQYAPNSESAFLRQAGLRVLPIARQTTRVGGGNAEGTTDAQGNVEAIFTAFTIEALQRQGGKFFMFLDVEGTASNPSLSPFYFQGWASTLRSHSLSVSDGAVELLPCVYARQADGATWHALLSAAAQGAQCFGAWSSHAPSFHACDIGPVSWSSFNAEPQTALPFEIFAWQFALDCGPLDYSQTNPALDAAATFLPFLIAP